MSVMPHPRAARCAKLATVLALAALSQPTGGEAKPRTVKPGTSGVVVDYGIALAGIPIGSAQLASAFAGNRYSMNISAQLTGLVGADTGGQGSAHASGGLADKPLPSAFNIATRTASSGIAVNMALANGNVSRAEITPPLVDMGDRVPVTAAAKRGIVDPASALVMPVQAHAELTDPANCNRTLPVFDGATRFNVVLSYGETRQVEKPGYSGPVLVCNARYVAIGGHRPDRPGVKFMEDNTDMSVWLAPVEGTRVLLPLRISVRTQIGTNIIEATRWARSGPTVADAQASSTAQASLAAR